MILLCVFIYLFIYVCIFLPFRESKMYCLSLHVLTFKLSIRNKISAGNVLKFHCNLKLRNCQISWLVLQYQYYAFLWYGTV